MKEFKKVTAVLLIFVVTALILVGCSKSENNSSSDVSSSQSVSSATSSSQVSSQSVSSSEVNSEERKKESSAVSASSTSTENQTAVSKATTSKKVTLTINASKAGEGYYVNSKSIEITSGESVYNVLKNWCTQNNIILAAKGKDTGVYVQAINGLAEFSKGGQSGWIYQVNGKVPSLSCGAYKLSGGEKITWIYTLDNGKTEGKG